MREKAGEQGAAYIPMPKGRGFTPHFDKMPLKMTGSPGRTRTGDPRIKNPLLFQLSYKGI